LVYLVELLIFVGLLTDQATGWASLSSAMLLEAVHVTDVRKKTAILKQQYIVTQYVASLGKYTPV